MWNIEKQIQMGESFQDFEADFLWKVSIKILKRKKINAFFYFLFAYLETYRHSASFKI